MKLFKVMFTTLILTLCVCANAETSDRQKIEEDAAAFLDRYLAVYNRRFGHPERSAQFRKELGDLVSAPMMLAPSMSKPQVPPSTDAFTQGFEGFVKMLESKNVARLQWQSVELHVLSENKVLANNVGHGITHTGELAYETVSLYLIYRVADSWKIALFSPYEMENKLRIKRSS